MESRTVLSDVLKALHEERSLSRFFTLCWRYGRETAEQNASLRRSFRRHAVGLVLAMLALDALVWTLHPGAAALALAVTGAVWLAAVLLVAWFLLGLLCTEDGSPLPRLGLPNTLTVTRLAFLAPMFHLVAAHDEFPALRAPLLGAFALLALSDAADGFLARRLRLESVFGRVVDPVSDMVFNSMVALALVLAGALPWWLLLLVWPRYFVPLVGGYYLFLTHGPFRIHPTRIGKLTGFVLGLLLGAALIEALYPGILPQGLALALVGVVAVLLLSNVVYVVLFGLGELRGGGSR